MMDLELGDVQARFAEILWANAPISSGELVKLCEKELNWKKPTTYTVLRKLCQKGLFQNRDGTVSALISQEEYNCAKSQQFVKQTFEGSLPAFIAAFTSKQALSADEIEEIQNMINQFRKER